MKKHRSVAMLAAVGLGLTLSAGLTQNATAAPSGAQPAHPRSSDDPNSLREVAESAGVLIGSGAIKSMTTTSDGRPSNYLAEPQFREVLAEEFNSLSPENDLEWTFVQPQEGVYDFEGLDRLVAFAQENDMEVKGHGLISACCNPDYLVAKIGDPVAFRAAMVEHFTTVMQRYAGKMDRWDVVSEALTTYGGEGLQHTDFYQALGPEYVAEAFRIAHAADPNAKLFLNENLVEAFPQKRQELYELVSGLVADGVPIHGVALQMHQTLQGPQPGVITEMANAYHALGLEVSIAELDVHTLDSAAQAQIYHDVVAEALNSGITEISFWGFTDKHLYTWLPGAKPLIFDEQYQPKAAYFAVLDALQDFEARPAVALQGVQADLDRYIAAGEARGPLAQQLTNVLRQAERHEAADRDAEAVSALQRALSRLENVKRTDRVSATAHDSLTRGINEVTALLARPEVQAQPAA
ncbi:endo-1,4-beta-xylanase [Kineococcus radiotolerans]|uniref:endo-1,4-beta-xylanase n=1 Tax=Kineococcus radiotolerans (strain ATCC BAA-149 / DSM 14245 / SRS30216) TaxID=266940 RepID=A6WB34_KINRD|nr:endo-1,4-beta-xylanase [Kineococcus radiotolerans]ABS04023.1 Endo-1,4-beta-xylanase [Kineococcus radiotolerans SRS30216 = ATCC BAA-149]